MRHPVPILLAALLTVVGLTACESQSRTRAIYMLIDTSGTYTQELSKAQQIVNFVLAKLYPGDTFAVAQINSASFTEKNIIARVTFDGRPSYATQQKRAFREQVDKFVSNVEGGSAYTDITGAVIQAAQYLNETGAPHRTILLFSDLKEEVPENFVREEIQLSLDGIRVVAVNVTKLRSDNIDPRNYMERLEHWKKRVQSGGGDWLVINDLERLDPILSDS